MTLLWVLMNLGFAGGGTLADGPRMLFLTDARLRRSAVTTANYQPTLALGASTVSDVRLRSPLATDIVLAHG